jgi:hypothetical protein
MNTPRTIAALEIWTVYRHPRNYPTQYVARKASVPGGESNEMFVANTLDEIHALLPRGLVRIPRFEADDPVIVEVWL